MISQSQVNEIKRLASLLATARVRNYAAKAGRTGSNGNSETVASTNKRVANAEDRLSTYLHTITDYDRP